MSSEFKDNATVSQFKSRFGREPVPHDVVRKALAKRQKEMARQFTEDLAIRAKIDQHLRKMQEPIPDIPRNEERVVEADKGLQELRKELQLLKPLAPTAPKLNPYYLEWPGIVPPVFSACESWPYLYGFSFMGKADTTWKEVSSVQADAKIGYMRFDIKSTDDGNAGGWAIAALGIGFSPPTDQFRNLYFESEPIFTYSWDYSWRRGRAITEGWIGLEVMRWRKTDGSEESPPVSQKIQLWNENHSSPWYWSVDRSFTDYNFGQNQIRLTARVSVDTDHDWALLVWCGGRAWGSVGEGGGGDYGNWASCGMQVFVPSMCWVGY